MCLRASLLPVGIPELQVLIQGQVGPCPVSLPEPNEA